MQTFFCNAVARPVNSQGICRLRVMMLLIAPDENAAHECAIVQGHAHNVELYCVNAFEINTAVVDLWADYFGVLDAQNQGPALAISIRDEADAIDTFIMGDI